jgi:Fe-S cluster assembly protein SufD
MNRSDAQVSALERSSLEWLKESLTKSEPHWLAQRRTLARDYFLAHGLPKSHDESFRFLPLTAVTSRQLRQAPKPVDAGCLGEKDAAWSASIGFFDGIPVGDVDHLPIGLRIDRLKHLLSVGSDNLEPLLGQLATPINGFAALGLAMFDDAWVVRVEAGATIDLPLEILVRQQPGGYWAIPRLLVIMEPRSRLTIVEKQVASDAGSFGLTTGVVEISVAECAQLTHVRLATRGEGEAELSTAAVEVDSGAHYHSWVGSIGGGLTRLDTHVRLKGTDARVSLDGLYVARNQELVDHHTVVVHECENTTAEESYRGIVDDEAQAVFDGQIIVKPGAQHTNAQQYNRNLILSDAAVVHAKPQLEIEADDVVCSHGATIGRLDAQQIFYLQSRGISAELAKQILTSAFASELIDRCPVSRLIPNIKRRVTSRLGAMEGLDW